MLASLFEEQRTHLNHFFDHLDREQAMRVFERVKRCSGSLLLTGVGKSGHIAEKVAATLLSTGTRALFLSPANALHGDLGVIQKGDLLLLFSKSGGSKELLDLLYHAKKKGAETIACVSVAGSRLAQGADLSICLPVMREICPYDLAPTTSTAAQLIFGDCLAIALMKERQFSLAELAANHPAGILGRKISLHISDLMLKGRELPLAQRGDPLVAVLHELSAKRCGCLLIVEGEELLGIFTDGDLRRALEKGGPAALQQTMGELMTPAPRTMPPGALALEALQEMEKEALRPVTVLPVVEKGKLVGLIRLHDILQHEAS